MIFRIGSQHMRNYFDFGVYLIVASILNIIFGLSFIIGGILFVSGFMVVWYVVRAPVRYFKFNESSVLSPVDGIVEEILDTSHHDEIENCKEIVIVSQFYDNNSIFAPISGSVIKEIISQENKFDLLKFLHNFGVEKEFVITLRSTFFCRFAIAGKLGKCAVESCIYSIIQPFSILENPEARMGDRVFGQHFGKVKMITRVFVPSHCDIKVIKGQTVIGSETILTKLGQ